MAKKTIMVIDDNVTNLNIARKALEDHYDVIPLLSGVKAIKVLEKNIPDLILLDVEMPEMSGFEVIGKIKEMGPPYNEIPVIFVTAKDDTSTEFEGLDLGAVDYVIKPFAFPLLLKRVELHLKVASQHKQIQRYTNNLEKIVEEQLEDIHNLQHAIIHTFGDMTERRDGSTGSHLIRTQEYLKILMSKSLEMQIYADELSKMSINEFADASQLHDIGKIGIPDAVLLKKGRLTFAEYEMMKAHTLIGEEAIRGAMAFIDDSEFLSAALDFTGAHHEKWDGSGYPRGLKEKDIPICGRLMAIADVYDALVSSRPYKKAHNHKEALEIMLAGEGIHFDPMLMKVFKEVHHLFEETLEKHKDHEPSFNEDIYDK